MHGGFEGLQRQARDEDVAVPPLEGLDPVAVQGRQPHGVTAPVDGQAGEGPAVRTRQAHAQVGRAIGDCARPDDGGAGDGAAEEPDAEGAGGLAAGVGVLVPVVIVGRPAAVFEAGGQGAAGLVELLVEPPGEKAAQFDDRGHTDGRAADGEQQDEPGGEPGAQGVRDARARPVHRPAGFRTYPAPRTVWIMGSRPASIFLRR